MKYITYNLNKISLLLLMFLSIILTCNYSYGQNNISTTNNVQSNQIQGVGYGRTTDEAKQNALSDLSQRIKVQVYSKLETMSVKNNNNKVSTQTNNFIKLTTQVPLLKPSIYYEREKGKSKAIAIIDKPELYIDKLNTLCKQIDEMTKDVMPNGNKALNYRLLNETQKYYKEYESYKTVADVLGFKGYHMPRISAEESLNLLLSMQETPPSLEVAAEVLTKNMKERNIYVETPMQAGSTEETEFGIFFKKLLESKLNSVKYKEEAMSTLSCSYANTRENLIMACNLLTGVSKILKSSVVNIPKTLTKDMKTLGKQDTSIKVNEYKPPKTDFKISMKISTENDPNFLRENEPFTLFVKVNKESYIYFVTYNNTEYGEANILPVGWEDKFLLHVTKDQIDTWVKVGNYRVKPPFGSEILQAFALTCEVKREYVLPEYASKNIGTLKNIRPEALLYDVTNLFKRQNCDKTMSMINYNTAPKRKESSN